MTEKQSRGEFGIVTEFGWLSWDGLRTTLGNRLSWYWSDLDGAHIGEPLPELPPIATHLWGWASAEWVRLRLDGDRVTGSRLVVARDARAGSSIVKKVAQPWPAKEGRVHIKPSDSVRKLARRRLILRTTGGEAPLVFLEVA